MPRKNKLLSVDLFRSGFHDAVNASDDIANALYCVNMNEAGRANESGIIQRLKNHFEPLEIEVIEQGSTATEMRLPSSDYDVILKFRQQDPGQVIEILKGFAESVGATIDPELKTPGNLVRMRVDGIQIDMMCVDSTVTVEWVSSLNTYMQDVFMCVYAFPGVPIRANLSCLSYVPDHMQAVQQMSKIITDDSSLNTAFLLTKLAITTKISSAAIVCLVTMSQFRPTSAFVVMQNMLRHMKAIADMIEDKEGNETISYETHAVFRALAQYHMKDKSIFVLLPFQLHQIAKALPDFTKFLKAMSLIDENEQPIEIGDRTPISSKLHSTCTALTQLLRTSVETPAMPDFMERARKIVCNY